MDGVELIPYTPQQLVLYIDVPLILFEFLSNEGIQENKIDCIYLLLPQVTDMVTQLFNINKISKFINTDKDFLQLYVRHNSQIIHINKSSESVIWHLFTVKRKNKIISQFVRCNNNCYFDVPCKSRVKKSRLLYKEYYKTWPTLSMGISIRYCQNDINN